MSHYLTITILVILSSVSPDCPPCKGGSGTPRPSCHRPPSVPPWRPGISPVSPDAGGRADPGQGQVRPPGGRRMRSSGGWCSHPPGRRCCWTSSWCWCAGSWAGSRSHQCWRRSGHSPRRAGCCSSSAGGGPAAWPGPGVEEVVVVVRVPAWNINIITINYLALFVCLHSSLLTLRSIKRSQRQLNKTGRKCRAELNSHTNKDSQSKSDQGSVRVRRPIKI